METTNFSDTSSGLSINFDWNQILAHQCLDVLERVDGKFTTTTNDLAQPETPAVLARSQRAPISYGSDKHNLRFAGTPTPAPWQTN